jgi:hypothetical protein
VERETDQGRGSDSRPEPPPPPPFPPNRTGRTSIFGGFIETRESKQHAAAWDDLMERRRTMTPLQRAIADEVYRQVWGS